jgi:hypothetical protein
VKGENKSKLMSNVAIAAAVTCYARILIRVASDDYKLIEGYGNNLF